MCVQGDGSSLSLELMKGFIAGTEPQVGDEAIDIVVKNLLSVGSLMSWKFIARKLGFSEGIKIVVYFSVMSYLLG